MRGLAKSSRTPAAANFLDPFCIQLLLFSLVGGLRKKIPEEKWATVPRFPEKEGPRSGTFNSVTFNSWERTGCHQQHGSGGVPGRGQPGHEAEDVPLLRPGSLRRLPPRRQGRSWCR